MGIAGASKSVIDQLTPTERECLLLVAEGLQSKEIAAATNRAAKTVDKHIENACKKLEVSGRRQAARLLAQALRNDHVEAPFPLSPNLSSPSPTSQKGGDDAARTPSPDHLGGVGGDLRRPRGYERAEGRGVSFASYDEADGEAPVTARSDARDFLHRARSPLRERSTARQTEDQGSWARVKRLAMIPILAAVAVAVIAAILGGGVQLQLALQALDRLFAG